MATMERMPQMNESPQLAIFGYSEAAMFLRSSPQPDITAIISIHGSREFGVEARAAC